MPSNDEKERLRALEELGILDTPPEEIYDDIVRLAAQVCATPIALITFVDGTRQWFKANIGMKVRETPRDVAFCAHAILEDDLMEIHDALLDDRFTHNPLVERDPYIRFYAGAPLITAAGHALGTLCAIDRQPRRLTEEQRESLRALSRLVVRELERR